VDSHPYPDFEEALLEHPCQHLPSVGRNDVISLFRRLNQTTPYGLVKRTAVSDGLDISIGQLGTCDHSHLSATGCEVGESSRGNQQSRRPPITDQSVVSPGSGQDRDVEAPHAIVPSPEPTREIRKRPESIAWKRHTSKLCCPSDKVVSGSGISIS